MGRGQHVERRNTDAGCSKIPQPFTNKGSFVRRTKKFSSSFCLPHVEDGIGREMSQYLANVNTPRSSVLVPSPVERALSKDEERIVTFLNYGIRANEDKIKSAAKTGRYATAEDAQAAALVLQTCVDAIYAGLHDAEHPHRRIHPQDEARLHLAGVK